MRFKADQVDFDRLASALGRRVADVPESLAWRYSSVAAASRRLLAEYRNWHAGDRCFVLANGPSLAATDIGQLRGEYTFSMNRAYLMYGDWGFQPSYYVCINDLVLEQFSSDIARLPMPKFLNFSQRKLFGEEACYLRIPPRLRERFNADVTRPITSGATVTYATLQLAFFMGFREVVILGMDHRFADTGTPNRTVVRAAAKDANHAHPDYFPQGIKWQLPDLVRSEHAYGIARTAYERAGRRIVDATVGGACTVFERRDLAAVLAEGRGNGA
jgi:hypothetical protein